MDRPGAPLDAHAAATADAVVIGAGVNGLVAANILADAGWDVVVCEAADEAGGACRSGESVRPGYVTDLFSGLRWSRAPQVLAHPLPDGRCAVLSTDLDTTARSLADFAPADAGAWRAQADRWQRIREPLVEALVATPFPPVRAGARLARGMGVARTLRFARFALLAVRRFADEEFAGEGAGLLLAGNALHTDLAPEAAGSALFGWLLAMLGQDVGFPVPQGGAGQLTAALVRRLHERGGQLWTRAPVADVLIRDGRARGVRLADGTTLRARRAVVADVDAVTLYRHLVAADQLPARLLADLDRFQWDNATMKINWALSAPIPWSDTRCAGAGTVHLGGTLDDLTLMSAQLACQQVPADPFLILGQMTTADPTRSPAGTESAWAYFHVPQTPRGDAGGQGITGRWSAGDVAALVERAEQKIERYAPGFRDLVVGREIQSPLAIEAANTALHRGALNGGTAGLHQQLVFRPVPGLGRPETPVAGLYLASMSAHPGGGVHGGPGAMAARVALRTAGTLGPVRRAATRAAHARIYAD